MKFRCCSLENSVLVVMFMPRRFKNPRKKGSITTKRVRSNYASRIDMGVVVSSDEGDCVIKTFKWITRSAMEAFIQSDEEIRNELAQEGVDFMHGIDDIFRLSKCVQIACFIGVLSLKYKIFYVRKHGNVAENSGYVYYRRLWKFWVKFKMLIRMLVVVRMFK